MTVYISTDQTRTLHLGNQVLKAAAALPQTATATLYTVSGGRVLITSLVGEVTTVIGATVTTLALGTAPTVGTAATAGLATATAITSKEVGTFVSPPTDALGGLVVTANAGTSLAAILSGYVVEVGTITWTTSASTTGAMKWSLTYIPLDTGASVA